MGVEASIKTSVIEENIAREKSENSIIFPDTIFVLIYTTVHFILGWDTCTQPLVRLGDCTILLVLV